MNKDETLSDIYSRIENTDMPKTIGELNSMYVKIAINALKSIPPSSRMEVFNEFCPHCGDIGPCICWNDE